MDVHSSASSSAPGSLFGDFIPHAMEGSLEWLSIYVEDCLSSTPTYFISPPVAYPPSSNPPPPPPQQPPIRKPSPVPAKARTKRRRLGPSSSSGSSSGSLSSLGAGQSLYAAPSEPLLHHQTCWLADSELLLPNTKREQDSKASATEPAAAAAAAAAAAGGEEADEEEEVEEETAQGRRCTHCLSQKTPQWRAGPLGPKTLCNACGVRYKSGRLLPEYRPAKSPTFVSYKHSNSHKKVMEMRMALLSPTTT